jgi:hypothetical protein
MGRWCLTRTVTLCICVFITQLLALGLLQSCKKDSASAPEPKAEAAGQETSRAVYGDKPVTRARKAHRKPTSAKDEPTRTARERSSPAKARSEQLPDPERRILNRGSITSNLPREKSGSGRFLYYQVPGARIGDPGELRSNAQELKRPPSANTVSGLIYHWADTLVSGDANAHMSLYAPALECSGLSRDALRRQKERLITALSALHRFEIHDLRVRKTGNGAAAAEFRVEWAAGQSRGSGSTCIA